MSQTHIVANNKFSSKEYQWKFLSNRVPKYDDTYTVAPTASNQDQWKFKEEDKEQNEKLNKQKKMQNKKEAKQRREQKELKKRAQQKVQKAQEEANTAIRSLLFEFKDKLDTVRNDDPIFKASQLVKKFASITDNDFAIRCAEHELLVLKVATQEYTRVLEENINSLHANMSLDPTELTKVPEYPTLPPVFFEELKKAEDKKNMELDSECPVCTENMANYDSQGLFQCPTCKKFAHLDCLEQWWERSNSCPCCRTQWN